MKSLRRVADRFWNRVLRAESLHPDKCWFWNGAVSRGCGMFWFGGGMVRATRMAWVLSVGPLPSGADVRHTCEEPLCVRPEHLTLVRSVRRDRAGKAIGHALHRGHQVAVERARRSYESLQRLKA